MSEVIADYQREKGVPALRSITVGQLAEVIFDGPFGSNLKSSDYVSKGARVVRLENVGHLRFIGEKQSFITLEKYERLKKHTLNAEDVLFSSFIDEEIRVCLFPRDHNGPAINKADCFCIRVDRSLCDPRWLAFRLARRSTYEELRERVHGATRPRINLSVLKSLRVELPSLSEQKRIVAKVEALYARTERVRREVAHALARLDHLERSILTHASCSELAAQDPNDERASALLGRIGKECTEAAGRAAKRKKRKQKV
jgi:type I restriction enzyme S subunit